MTALPTADLPFLRGSRVTIRPGASSEAALLWGIVSEPSVVRWWGEPASIEEIAADLRGDTEDRLLVVEVDGAVAGGIQYSEDTEPMYRHAGMDCYLSLAAQDRGLGAEAVGMLARWLVAVRQHHRLTIDPAADNVRAIRCYASVGFKPVGIMRAYERGLNGTFHDALLMDLLRSELSAP